MVRRRLTLMETASFKLFKEMHGAKQVGMDRRATNPEYRKLVHLVGATQRTGLRARFNEFLFQRALETPELRNGVLEIVKLTTHGMDEHSLTKKSVDEFNARIGVFEEAVELKEAGLKIEPSVALKPNFLGEFNRVINAYFKSAFGINQIKVKPTSNLIREIFRYYPKVASWETARSLEKGSFQKMIKAYFEGGKEGLKALKFSTAPEGEKAFNVMREADKLSSKGKTKKIDYYKDLFGLHLESFRGHLKQNKFSFNLQGQELKRMFSKAQNTLIQVAKEIKPIPGVNINTIIEAVNSKDVVKMNKIIGQLQRIDNKKLSNSMAADKGQLLGALKMATSVVHLEEGFLIFKDVLPKLMKLKGKSHQEQKQLIGGLKRKYPQLQNYIETFQKMGASKALFYGDVANIFKDLMEARENTTVTESNVSARLTYNLEEIFSSDKFRDNCINPNKIGYHVVGFTIDPQESFIGFYEKGYAGFSLIHLMKKGNKRVIYVEAPYTNNSSLTGAMRTSAEGLVEQIIELGKKKGVTNLTAQYSWDSKSKDGLEAFPVVHSNKYYDVFGKVVK